MEQNVHAKKPFSTLGLGIFMILLVGTVAQILAIVLMDAIMPDWGEQPWGMWLVTFAPLYLIAVPIGLLVMRKAPAKAPSEGSIKGKDFLKILIISVFMMYAGNLVGTIITALLQSITGVSAGNPIMNYAMGTALFPKILFMVVLGPIIEEYVFRKQLIDRMRPYGEKTAIIVSALMFGLFHGNLAQLFYAFTLGLVFGYVYIKTGKLRYSIGLHMFINCLGGVVAPALLEKAAILESIDMADTAALTAAAPWALAFLLYAVLLLGSAIAGLVLAIRNRKVRFAEAEFELPKEGRFKTIYLNPGMLLFILGCLALTVVNTIFA